MRGLVFRGSQGKEAITGCARKMNEPPHVSGYECRR